jgi:hypothetical protein
VVSLLNPSLSLDKSNSPLTGYRLELFLTFSVIA